MLIIISGYARLHFNRRQSDCSNFTRALALLILTLMSKPGSRRFVVGSERPEP